MSEAAKLPGYLKYANKVIKLFVRLGISPGPIRVISVPGRKTGKLRATPVAPFEVEGRRYVVAGLDKADWVENARAAGWAVVKQGRRSERVTMVELPIPERAAILREFPRLVPNGVEFFTKVHGVSADPEEFAGLAPKCPVFRLDASA